MSKRFLTVREALCEGMREEMIKDQSVFIIGEEVGEYNGAYKVTQGLLDEFGAKRVVDCPISEHAFTGIAVGAAFNGLKPIVEFMTFNFAMQAIDHIVNSAAKTLYMSGGSINCPIVFRGPNGAAKGVGAQHSQNYSAWYSHIPGLKVINAYSAQDAKFLLKEAIQDPNPVIFLENEVLYGESFEVYEEQKHKIGQAEKIKEGKDLTISTFSIQNKMCLLACEELEKKGIYAEVIDLKTIRPLDKQTIFDSVKKTNRLVVVEEGWFFSGVGATISSIVSNDLFDYLDAPVEVVSAKDAPLPYAPNLEKLALPSVENIVNAALKACYKS